MVGRAPEGPTYRSQLWYHGPCQTTQPCAVRSAPSVPEPRRPLALVADTAQATLPDPVAVESWLLWFAWRDGSRRWQPGLERYDTQRLATGAQAIKQASPDYANITVTGPHPQTLPGA
jgi:hypothetical protein